MLRARLPAADVSVIPNAVECAHFTPDAEQFVNNALTIVFVGRLVYRKGADLVIFLLD